MSTQNISEIVSGLRYLLGNDKLVGLVAGDQEWSEEIDSWARGVLFPPRVWMEKSLREAYGAALLLGRVMSETDLRSWFVSLHPATNFSEAPVEVVHQDPKRFRRLVNTTYANLRGDLCPECGGKLHYVGGFRGCSLCGFSET